MKKGIRQLSPIGRAMKSACQTGDIPRLARLYNAARTLDTRVTGAIFLAAQFHKNGNYRAARVMFRRARLHAADEYSRLLYINMVEESLDYTNDE